MPRCRSLRLHSHPFSEIVYIRSGTALHCHRGNRYPLFAGDCFVVSPDEEHGFYEAKKFSLTNILYYPEMLDGYAGEYRGSQGITGFLAIEPLFRTETGFRHKLHLQPSRQRLIAGLLDRLQDEYDGRLPGYRSMCKALFNEAVVSLGRMYASHITEGSHEQVFDAGGKLINNAVTYLEQHAHDDISAAQVARSAFVSISTLSYAFKKQTGVSLSEYVTKIRIDKACELLQTSRDSLSRVAMSVGFQDPAYFSRVFKKTLGETPFQYRKSRLSRSA